MDNPAKPAQKRALVTLIDKPKLILEAKKKGLRLAEYLRHLIATHPERASGAGRR